LEIEGIDINQCPRLEPTYFKILVKMKIICLYAIGSCLEVGLSIDSLSVLDRPEENHSGQSVAGDEEEHAHDDEEALVHAHKDGLHEHLQGGVLAGDGEET
jgi:hypothetical protein